MHVNRYLERIGYAGPRTPDAATLRGLHRAHMLAVPFENLSIHTGEKIQLTEDWLYEKIVMCRRGGFCYECNGLFAALLRKLGFTVTLLSARVRKDSGEGYGPEFDHMILKVDLDEPWLADVGFGDSFLEPLKFVPGLEQDDPAGKFRIIEVEGDFGLDEWVAGAWQTQHLFSLTPHSLDEYKKMCHYHQTSWQSPFTRKITCSLALPVGRITLSGDRLIHTEHGTRDEKILIGEEVIEGALTGYFGVEINLREARPRGKPGRN